MEYAAKAHRRTPRRAVCVTEVFSITSQTSEYPQRFRRASGRGYRKALPDERALTRNARGLCRTSPRHVLARNGPFLGSAPSPRNVLDSENRCLTFHGEASMSKRRSIAVLLVAAAYWTAAYGNTLWFMVPAVGSGIPAVQRAAGQKKEAPRPFWTSRRHLPLVKSLSFPHFPTNPGEPTSDPDRPGSHLLPPVSPACEGLFDSPSPSRAPPVS